MSIDDFLKKYSSLENDEMRKDLEVVVSTKIKRTPIAMVFNFNERILTKLKGNDIITIEDLSIITKERFMILGYCGRVKLKRVEEVLAKFGMSFKEKI